MVKLSDKQLENLKRNTLVMHDALSQRCMDCNLCWHPLVMTFDHVDRHNKNGGVREFVIAESEVFDEELAKCDVVCRNCHQVREYLRDYPVLQLKPSKQARYNYYAELIPYLAGGGLLRYDAFEIVTRRGL